MDKKPVIFCGIVVMVILALAAYALIYPNPEKKLDRASLRPGLIRSPIPMPQAVEADAGIKEAPEMTPAKFPGAVIGLALLAACLCGALYRSIRQTRRVKPMPMSNALVHIAAATGKNEYDLFRQSAEAWAVSPDRIDPDFKRYMRDQQLPFYVIDFIRKNKDRLEELEKHQPAAEPTSWSDWAKALLVFPGAFVVMFFMFKYFERF